MKVHILTAAISIDCPLGGKNRDLQHFLPSHSLGRPWALTLEISGPQKILLFTQKSPSKLQHQATLPKILPDALPIFSQDFFSRKGTIDIFPPHCLGSAVDIDVSSGGPIIVTRSKYDKTVKNIRSLELFTVHFLGFSMRHEQWLLMFENLKKLGAA